MSALVSLPPPPRTFSLFPAPLRGSILHSRSAAAIKCVEIRSEKRSHDRSGLACARANRSEGLCPDRMATRRPRTQTEAFAVADDDPVDDAPGSNQFPSAQTVECKQTLRNL